MIAVMWAAQPSWQFWRVTPTTLSRSKRPALDPRSDRLTRTSSDSLSVGLGGWFKANATGRGIFVIGVIVVALVAGALAQGWVG